MRIQRRGIKRQNIGSAVLWQVRSKITALAERYDCSKSFVINTILAEALHIKTDEVYYEDRAANRRIKKSA